MAYDFVIKNGTVVDGTGAPAKRVDVAILDGKIVEIGKIDDGADEIIDAGDCVVAGDSRSRTDDFGHRYHS